jgi:hypothetical protein
MFFRVQGKEYCRLLATRMWQRRGATLESIDATQYLLTLHALQVGRVSLQQAFVNEVPHQRVATVGTESGNLILALSVMHMIDPRSFGMLHRQSYQRRCSERIR